MQWFNIWRSIQLPTRYTKLSTVSASVGQQKTEMIEHWEPPQYWILTARKRGSGTVWFLSTPLSSPSRFSSPIYLSIRLHRNYHGHWTSFISIVSSSQHLMKLIMKMRKMTEVNDYMVKVDYICTSLFSVVHAGSYKLTINELYCSFLKHLVNDRTIRQSRTLWCLHNLSPVLLSCFIYNRLNLFLVVKSYRPVRCI